MKSWKIWKNLLQVLIAFDQLIYCLIATILSIFNPSINAYADLTISAQAYRKRDTWYGKILKFLIDTLFYCISLGSIKNHCEDAYKSELNNKHLPQD